MLTVMVKEGSDVTIANRFPLGLRRCCRILSVRLYRNLTIGTTEKMSHAVHRHFPLIDVTYVLLAKLVRSRPRWLDIGRAPFCALIEKQKKERGHYPDILTEQA